jgi:hypothetical protein
MLSMGSVELSSFKRTALPSSNLSAMTKPPLILLQLSTTSINELIEAVAELSMTVKSKLTDFG